jgi:predicted transcriptional regulator
MTAKPDKIKTQPLPRYAAEDLAPRDPVADEAASDAYLQRNRDALNASIEKAHAEFERGKYFTLDQVMADVNANRQRKA